MNISTLNNNSVLNLIDRTEFHEDPKSIYNPHSLFLLDNRLYINMTQYICLPFLKETNNFKELDTSTTLSCIQQIDGIIYYMKERTDMDRKKLVVIMTGKIPYLFSDDQLYDKLINMLNDRMIIAPDHTIINYNTKNNTIYILRRDDVLMFCTIKIEVNHGITDMFKYKSDLYLYYSNLNLYRIYSLDQLAGSNKILIGWETIHEFENKPYITQKPEHIIKYYRIIIKNHISHLEPCILIDTDPGFQVILTLIKSLNLNRSWFDIIIHKRYVIIVNRLNSAVSIYRIQ